MAPLWPVGQTELPTTSSTGHMGRVLTDRRVTPDSVQTERNCQLLSQPGMLYLLGHLPFIVSEPPLPALGYVGVNSPSEHLPSPLLYSRHPEVPGEPEGD